MTLKESLEKKKKNSSMIMPGMVVKKMASAIDELVEDGLDKRAKNVGDTFDDGILLNNSSEEVNFYDLLDGRKAIVSFYRGSWCPYCNLELRAYEELMNKDENKDVIMFAISPEMPDVTLKKQDIDKLNFEVLSDPSNKLAEKLHLVFHLNKDLHTFYGSKVRKSTGTDEENLPIAATYVIDSDKKIINAWVDADYKKRGEPKDVLKAYRDLK